jgi:hypothetical protein
MLAIADELAAHGAHVSLAGGGAGQRFVELNGYDAFEPTPVDYIDTYQHGAVHEVFTRSLPATAARLSEYVRWLREESPDALVTDDMFAAMAARRVGVPQYVLKHDLPGLYESRVERAGAGFHTRFQLAAARAFFQPTVWPETGREPSGVTRIPPVALEGGPDGRAAAAARDPDVVVVPSAYSDLSRVATHLERQGFDTLDVGSESWEAVPSLLPYLRAADLVVCSGYSTVMDAAVAGTPCIVSPATDEQRAVADRLRDTEGFAVADGPLDVLDAAADPPAAPAFENGAPVVAERVLTDLRDGHEPTADGREAGGRVRRSLGRWRDGVTATAALLGAVSLFAWAGLSASAGRVAGGTWARLLALYATVVATLTRDGTAERNERTARTD